MLQKLKDDEDQQLKILDLMANTLLPDENLFIGFMPLKSYIQSKKDVKTGVKCPQEKEELIRCLILKEALDKLGCTYENFTEASKISRSRLKSKSNSPQKETDEMFSKIDELDDTDKMADTKPLVVIDA